MERKDQKGGQQQQKNSSFLPGTLLTSANQINYIWCYIVTTPLSSGKVVHIRKFLYKMSSTLTFHIWLIRISLRCLSQTDAEENGILSSRRDIELRTHRVSTQLLWYEDSSWGWAALGNSGWHAGLRLSAVCHSSLFLLCQLLSPAAVNKVHLKQPSLPLVPFTVAKLQARHPDHQPCGNFF